MLLHEICGNKPENRTENTSSAISTGPELRVSGSSAGPTEHRAVIRCRKCGVTAPERGYVRSRCLLAGAGAVAQRHSINYGSLPSPAAGAQERDWGRRH